jgi:hypothetical protein
VGAASLASAATWSAGLERERASTTAGEPLPLPSTLRPSAATPPTHPCPFCHGEPTGSAVGGVPYGCRPFGWVAWGRRGVALPHLSGCIRFGHLQLVPIPQTRCAFRLVLFSAGSRVGVAGFEPATSRSQSECATRLRYTPWVVCFVCLV